MLDFACRRDVLPCTFLYVMAVYILVPRVDILCRGLGRFHEKQVWKNMYVVLMALVHCEVVSTANDIF